MATILPCATYQKYYDVLLRIEDSDKMLSESEKEEEIGSNLKKYDKGKWQSSQGPRQTQSFKKSGLVLVLPVGVSVLLVRGEVVGSLKDLACRGQERHVG